VEKKNYVTLNGNISKTKSGLRITIFINEGIIKRVMEGVL